MYVYTERKRRDKQRKENITLIDLQMDRKKQTKYVCIHREKEKR